MRVHMRSYISNTRSRLVVRGSVGGHFRHAEDATIENNEFPRSQPVEVFDNITKHWLHSDMDLESGPGY